MEKTEITNSGFTIKSLLLSESSFTRKPNVVFEGDPQLNVSNNMGIKDNNIVVKLTVTLVHSANGEEDYRISVTMIGFFEHVGDTSITMDSFGKVNGPAIIYPFIREHIANIAWKGGLGSVIVPPLNFAKVNQQAPMK